MLISQLYQSYPVPINLAEHMLLVASVGTWLAQHLPTKLADSEQDLITQSLLLHDLANIIKFDLTQFVRFLKPQDHDLAYWKIQQQSMISKYGKDEHQALLSILKELAVDTKVFDLLAQLSIYQVKEIVAGNNFPLKICLYADYRVAPYGLVSLEERVQDLVKRYHQREPNLASADQMTANLQALNELEQQLAAELLLPLNALTINQVAPLTEKLKGFQVV